MPPGLTVALAADEEGQALERERLLYTACTRARDLLIVPDLRQASPRCWARIVGIAAGALPEIDLTRLAPALPPPAGGAPNGQTATILAAERRAIDAAAVPLEWLRPSDADPDRMAMTEVFALEPGEPTEAAAPIGAERFRGLCCTN